MDGISVVIPVWNRAEQLAVAVRSALAQSTPPREVLVCDDGSTDGTEEFARRLAREDPRVRWIAGERIGRPAVPRNRGIAQAAGEWIAFLDSDDRWMPSKLERQLARARRDAVRAVATNAERIGADGAGAGILLRWPSDRIRLRDLLRMNPVVCSSALLHRSLFAAVEGFPEPEPLTAVEDYALWWRVATQTDFAFIDEPLVAYRDAPDESLRGRWSPASGPGRELILRDFLDWARRHPVPADSRLAVRLLELRLRWRRLRRGVRSAVTRTRYRDPQAEPYRHRDPQAERSRLRDPQAKQERHRDL